MIVDALRRDWQQGIAFVPVISLLVYLTCKVQL